MKAQQEQAAKTSAKKDKGKEKKGKTAVVAIAEPGSPSGSTRRSGRSSKQLAVAASDPKKRKAAAAKLAETTAMTSPSKQLRGGKKKRKVRMDSADFDETMAEDAIVTKMADEDGDVDTSVRHLPDGTEVSKRQPKLFVGGALRDYQLDGMDWLTALYDNGANPAFFRHHLTSAVVFPTLFVTLFLLQARTCMAL
jgi:ATP-dependent DNA helicase